MGGDSPQQTTLNDFDEESSGSETTGWTVSPSLALGCLCVAAALLAGVDPGQVLLGLGVGFLADYLSDLS